MSKWMYEDHLGGYYLRDEELPADYLYCEECGDSDIPLGKINSMADGWNKISDMIAIDDEDGGYLPEYIIPLLMPAATDEEKEILKIVCGDIKVNNYGLCTTPKDKLLEAVKEMGGTIGKEEE